MEKYAMHPYMYVLIIDYNYCNPVSTGAFIVSEPFRNKSTKYHFSKEFCKQMREWNS